MLSLADAGRILGITPNRVKQLIKKHNLEMIQTTRIKVPSYTMEALVKIRKTKFNNPKKITIATEKGGVGKTFLTVNTAALCAERGIKTLVIDVDPEACASNSLLPDDVDYRNSFTLLEIIQHNRPIKEAIQKTKYENLFIVPCKPLARRTEKLCLTQNPKYLASRILASIENEFDLILFDLPPSFTNLVASFYLTSDLVVQPCEPSIYCEESIDLTTADIEEACKEYDCPPPKNLVLLNFFRESEIASRETRHSLEARYPGRVIPFEINKSQDAINLINAGKTIVDVPLSLKDDLVKFVDFLAPLQPAEKSEEEEETEERIEIKQ